MTARVQPRVCEVLLNTDDCTAPPNMNWADLRGTRATCFECGGPACTACSRITWSFERPRKKRRICNDCLSQRW